MNKAERTISIVEPRILEYLGTEFTYYSTRHDSTINHDEMDIYAIDLSLDNYQTEDNTMVRVTFKNKNNLFTIYWAKTGISYSTLSGYSIIDDINPLLTEEGYFQRSMVEDIPPYEVLQTAKSLKTIATKLMRERIAIHNQNTLQNG